ncbi:hypothetical protein K8352_10800 [Flavobacteriaceae bacterium F89]|jgi:hypothetical protein|uniref:Nicotinate-nucleotide adenylyltransferase n=1 Tax=Cerina litoralis TaxID=2874477 RepID=A0AAE3EVS4_9FLAO|nr:hypothetical protein [Cerina litoralis]MCG2461238.1 hypothetical protein [Cerina litoralis]
MKTMILGLLFMGMALPSYAQDVLYEAKLKKEDVPTVVVDAVERDYPGLTVDEYTAVPVEYVENDVFLNKNLLKNRDYETYEISLVGNGENLDATYNKRGKRVSVTERLINVAPPMEVRETLAKTYPGWTIKEDSYKMTSYHGDTVRSRYRFELKKGNQTKKVYIDEQGNILNRSFV